MPLLRAIDARVSAIIESVWKREVEFNTLAVLRKTLPSKLISGEVRVKGAERFIGRTM